MSPPPTIAIDLPRRSTSRPAHGRRTSADRLNAPTASPTATSPPASGPVDVQRHGRHQQSVGEEVGQRRPSPSSDELRRDESRVWSTAAVLMASPPVEAHNGRSRDAGASVDLPIPGREVGDGDSDELRLAELLCALSVTLDLAMAQPPEKSIRSCLVATRLADRLGVAGQAHGLLRDPAAAPRLHGHHARGGPPAWARVPPSCAHWRSAPTQPAAASR